MQLYMSLRSPNSTNMWPALPHHRTLNSSSCLILGHIQSVLLSPQEDSGHGDPRVYTLRAENAVGASGLRAKWQ
uniref:Uncharacterized protein n=1 Tax=Knipowitschia caucasica TaxID=637954 RepID=A0AAV2JMY2_KNICA